MNVADACQPVADRAAVDPAATLVAEQGRPFAHPRLGPESRHGHRRAPSDALTPRERLRVAIHL